MRTPSTMLRAVLVFCSIVGCAGLQTSPASATPVTDGFVPSLKADVHASWPVPRSETCISCHRDPQDDGDGVPPGGRRAVVREFPPDEAHAHYGSELSDDACVICHDGTNHADGRVELLDPDDGSIYRFLKPQDLTSDSDVSTFCAGCHDADGAMRLPAPSDPFGNGNTPPNVASQLLGTLQWDEWYGGPGCFGDEGTLRAVNSHHDISDVDRTLSGARIECLNFYRAHRVSASRPVGAPWNTTTPWIWDPDCFCLEFHDGGTSIINGTWGCYATWVAMPRLPDTASSDRWQAKACNIHGRTGPRTATGYAEPKVPDGSIVDRTFCFRTEPIH